jgi:hypothetical protein
MNQQVHIQTTSDSSPQDAADYLKYVETNLETFTEQEKARLEMDAPTEQWRDPAYSTFTADQRAHTTILFAGLTMTVLLIGMTIGTPQPASDPRSRGLRIAPGSTASR